MRDSETLSDENRLLFGAGFVFGVACTMVLTAIVTVTVVDSGALAADVLATIAGGTLFTAIVGTSLYVLAFPENRPSVPVERLFEHSDRDGNADVGTERL